jgi:hypothetical protein
VTPKAETLAVGATTQLTAVGYDSHGSVVGYSGSVWTSSNPQVATVTQNGQLTTVSAISPGQARVSATFGSVSGNSDITVLAGPVGNRDFAIASAQITQGVQDSAGSIPMVLDGNPAVVNVFMRATPASAASSRVVLRLLDAGGAVVYADTATTAGTISSATASTSPTLQFLVPSARLAAGKTWQVVRDPAGLVPDDSAADDVYPRDGGAPLATLAVSPLTIRFVPIVLGADGGTTGSLSTADFPDYLRTLKSVHPLGVVSAHIGPSFVTSVSFGTPPSGGDVPFWGGLILQLDLARIADPTESDVNWFGVVLPPPGFNFTSTGGITYIASNVPAGAHGGGRRPALVRPANAGARPRGARVRACLRPHARTLWRCWRGRPSLPDPRRLARRNRL